MIKKYINSLHQTGHPSFSSSEAMSALGISKAALAMAISRLKKKNELVSPYRDFYVPIPPEYHSLGCLPAEQLIPPLMKHIGIPYYVCLLSAAAMHGAAHQRPQITQVMMSKRMRNIRCGNVGINYIYKKNISHIPVMPFTVRTGYLQVSTPEATIMDLLLYIRQSGGINHIATILTELIDAINPQLLLALAKSSREIAWVQRLGLLLEHIDPDESGFRNKSVNLLSQYIKQSKPSFVPLIPGTIKAYARNKQWRILINAEIESDI